MATSAFDMQLGRGEDGVLRASVAAPYEMLGDFLGEDVGDNDVAATYFLMMARRVATGMLTRFAEECYYFSLEMEDGKASLAKDSDSPALQIDLNDFIEALAAWQALTMEGVEQPPVVAFLKGLGCTTRGDAQRFYEEALPELKAHRAELLGDKFGLALIGVVEDYLDWNDEAQARQWLDLLHATEEFNGDPGYLFLFIERCFALEQMELVEELLTRAEAWVPHIAEEQKLDYQCEVGHHYKCFLQHLNRESELTKLHDDLEEVDKAITYLTIELYKATGLYAEYVKSSGAMALLGGLAQQLFTASGGLYGSNGAPPAMAGTSKENLDAMLRASVHKNAQSTSLYNQLVETADSLEKRWQSIPADDAPSAAFYRLVQYHVDKILTPVRNLKSGDSATAFDVTPPTCGDATDRSTVTLPPAGPDGELLASIVSMFNLAPPDRPGSPNEQPVIKWSQRKTAGLRFTHPEMATRLSGLGYGYIDYFHENQNTAVARYADDLESEFAQRPQFVVECLSELAKVFQHLQRTGEADMLLARLDKYKDCPRPADGDADLVPSYLGIYVPVKSEKQGEALCNAIKSALSAAGEEFPLVGYSLPEDNRLRPGEEFMRIEVEGDNMDEVRRLVDKVMQDMKSELPFEILLEFGGVTEPWKTD
ncbi:MAG: hypothetical protein U0105_13445 [Candidatus Obscuribacterales bacterium]